MDLAFCTLRSRQLTQSLDQISSFGYFTFLVKCLRLGQDLRSAIPNARHQAYSGHRIVEGVLRFDKRLAIAISWDEVRTQAGHRLGQPLGISCRYRVVDLVDAA
ncbi:hypothetical protein IPC1020_31315 [Pseudomonas aeruginosa]|nr:hypothetical protein IPC1280_04375 [Pseudomonas aeruginosa]RPR98060.1 hypothetical protein IPC1020_31315 [Pseudomonas aeruginosa]